MSQPPLWRPNPGHAQTSAMARFLAQVGQQHPDIADYDSLHRWSVQSYQAFWRTYLRSSGIVYEGDDQRVVQRECMPGAEFFPDVRLSFSENLLRRDDDGIALVSISEARETVRLTYAQLRTEVARVQHGLAALGVSEGDRVAAFIPNISETVIAMLAAANLGAVWTSCSPDFGVQGAVDRFGQIQPKVLLTANTYVYNGKPFDCIDKCRAIAQAIGSIEHLIVIDLHAPAAAVSTADTVAWLSLGSGQSAPLRFVRRSFNHPQYILYSSGTTGIPKCIVHGAGGTLLQHAKELVLHCDLRADDNIMYFTTCGWMMWNWLVSGLFAGATVTLFDGSPSYPKPTQLWEVAQREGVTHFGTSAKFLASCRGKMSPKATYPSPRLRVVLSTGSPLLPEDFDWVYEHVGPVQLSSVSGGTDIISCFMLGNPLLPVYRGEIQCFGLGMDVVALDEQQRPVLGEKGELVCRKPFPSMPIYFWDDVDGSKFHKAYFAQIAGVWCHGDYISVTGSQGHCGGIVVYGRSDATLKPQGVRIGTAEIYRLVETLSEIEDSVVIGQPWQGDVRVVLFVKLAAGVSWSDLLAQSIKSTIRAGATPRHVPAVVLPVNKVPYTRSGKKMELAVLQVVRGEEPKNLEAAQDPSALDCYRDLEALRR